MATVYSAQKTKWDQTSPALNIKANEMSGRMRIAHGTYEASAEQSDIEMFNLPHGARLVSGTLAYDALGASTTLSVGYAAYTDNSGAAVTVDVDAYKVAAASTSAAKVDILATLALGSGTEVDANSVGLPVTVSLAGGNGTGTIELTITYVVD